MSVEKSEDSLYVGLDFEKCLESERLKSYKNWPFEDNCPCTVEKMAEAGFYHCPSDREPDLVRCFVCFKELDGWEENDDPWEEHASHSPKCLFVKLHKKESELTIEQLVKLQCERVLNKLKKNTEAHMNKFTRKTEKIRKSITNL